ncbi:hypothetical protein [Arthrobacter sp. W4I7]|uniref:hypothetical protein n=1 Tax=Arthrobacter sp. W4I7 TaxID=3042296 RepID=UPI0027898EA5|nr:hypothetical protein [Arthrobacter sp. W4I7]MDQ0692593.1 hypothetical protein [Arthrobacter sp. W4I7]
MDVGDAVEVGDGDGDTVPVGDVDVGDAVEVGDGDTVPVGDVDVGDAVEVGDGDTVPVGDVDVGDVVTLQLGDGDGTPGAGTLAAKDREAGVAGVSAPPSPSGSPGPKPTGMIH